MKDKKELENEKKDFFDALTGKREISVAKSIFSPDNKVHFKDENINDIVFKKENRTIKHNYDDIIDEYEDAIEFAEDYFTEFDSYDDAVEYFEGLKEERDNDLKLGKTINLNSSLFDDENDEEYEEDDELDDDEEFEEDDELDDDEEFEEDDELDDDEEFEEDEDTDDEFDDEDDDIDDEEY